MGFTHNTGVNSQTNRKTPVFPIQQEEKKMVVIKQEQKNEILEKENVPKNSCVVVEIVKVTAMDGLISSKTNKPYMSFCIEVKHEGKDMAIWAFESEIGKLGASWGDTDNWNGKKAEFWLIHNTKGNKRWNAVPLKT